MWFSGGLPKIVMLLAITYHSRNLHRIWIADWYQWFKSPLYKSCGCILKNKRLRVTVIRFLAARQTMLHQTMLHLQVREDSRYTDRRHSKSYSWRQECVWDRDGNSETGNRRFTKKPYRDLQVSWSGEGGGRGARALDRHSLKCRHNRCHLVIG